MSRQKKIQKHGSLFSLFGALQHPSIFHIARWLAPRTLTDAPRALRRPRTSSLEQLETRQVFATLAWVGTNSDLWSDSANWSPAQTPVDGDALSFNSATAGLARFDSQNDLVNLQLGNIAISDTSAAGNFSLSGNALSLGASGWTHSSNNGNTAIAFAGITLSGNSTFTANGGAGNLAISSPITINGQLLTLTGTASGTVSLDGIISGPGGITKLGSGSFVLGVGNSYDGNTTATAGNLYVNADSGLGSAAGGTTINGGSLFLGLVNAGLTIDYTTPEPLTLGASGSFRVQGNDARFAGNVLLVGTGSFQAGPSSAAFEIAGTISDGAGSFGVNKTGGGVLILSGNNTYDGTTAIAGTLVAASESALGSTAGNTTATGVLQFSNVTYAALEDVIVPAGGGISSAGNASFAGNILLTGAATITAGAGTFELSGVITDGASTFNLSKAGAGTLVLSGSNDYSGNTVIIQGPLSVTSIGNATTPGGLGQSDSRITLGATNTTGTLLYTGAGETTARDIHLGGTTGGGGINASGTGPLVLTGNFTITATAKTLTLSGNGVGIVQGTLFDVAQANLLTKAGSGTWTLEGGSNNNFTGLTTVSAGTLQLKKPAGINAIGGNLTISSGATLELLANNQIPVGALTVNGTLLSPGVDAANTLAISSLNMTGGNIDTGLGTLVLGGTATVGAGNSSIAGKLDLSSVGAQTFSVTGNLTVSAPISGSAAGITKAGAGTLVLGSSNIYAGTTSINQGIIRVSSIGNSSTPGGLGQSDTVINLGSAGTTGTLQYVGAGETTNRTINLAGAAGGGGIDASGSGLLVINGDVTTAPTVKTLTLTGNGTGIIQGTLFDVAQANLLSKSGTGTWTLAGSNSNNFTGLTTVSGGILQLQKPAGVDAIGGNLTVANGGTLSLLASDQIPNAATVTVSLGGTFDLNSQSDAVGPLTVNGSLINTTGNESSSLAITTLSVTAGSISTGLGKLVLGGTVSTGAGNSSIAGNLDLNGAQRIFNGGGTLNISAVISGSAGITKNAAGTLILSNTNTYSGVTTLSAGTLVVAANGALGTTAAGTTAASGTNLRFDNVNYTTLETITSTNTTLRVASGNSSFAGNITLAAGSTVSSDDAAATLTLSGPISAGNATFSLAKNGNGTVVLGGTNTYGGTTQINAGVLVVNGQVPGNVSVNSGATLAGGGSVGPLTVTSGGTVSPGSSPGVLTVNGNATFISGSSLIVDINGTTPGASGYDKLLVNGVVTLNGPTLSGSTGFLPSGSDTFKIIESTVGNPILPAGDKFSNAPVNGATVVLGGQSYTIDYLGGDGNDVVLAAISSTTTLSIAATSAVNAEGNSGSTPYTFTITRSGDTSGPTSVDFAVAGIGAGAIDFNGSVLPGGTISFAGGETTKVITVQVNGDTLFESNEEFTVTLSNATGGTAIGTGIANGTIQNDDDAPTLSIGNVSLNEGASGTTNFVFTVTQSATSGLDSTVVFSTAAGSATAGSDFRATSGTLTIAAGTTTGTITVAVAGDAVLEANEAFTVDLSSPSNATIASGTATGTIQNDDGGLTLSIGNVSLNEGNSGTTNFVFTVTQSVISGLDTTVVFSTAAGTATAGSDFTATSGTLTIAAGATTGAITVAVAGDALVEASETFTVNLSSPSSATIASGTATGTIQNDDTAPTLSIGNVNLNEGASGTTNFVFTVTQSATSGLDTTVIFSTAAGTAAAGSDFTATSGTLTIAAGSTTGTITVAVAGDAVLEANETFTINLSSPDNATIASGTATGTIQNDDGGLTLSIGNLSLSEGASGTTNFVFTVTQSATSGLDTTVFFSIAAGTATAGSDFTATSGTLTIAAGATTGTITVAVAGDVVLEANEAFTVNLSSPSNSTIASGTATGTIQNDDTAPTLSIGNASLNEGNSGTTNFVFTVTQSAISGLDTTVVFSTAAGTATAGSDFTATSGTLTIAAGATSGTITVAVSGDAVLEASESFTVDLSNPDNATIASGTATGTIQNDDTAPTLSIGNVSLNEGNGGTTTFVFTVTKSSTSGLDTTVVFNTAAGTAVAGSDFTASSGTLTIAAGATTGTITVAVAGDAVLEASETFTVDLSSPSNATIDTGTAVGTIQNDDTAPTLSIGIVSLNEGNSGTTNFVFTVTQSAISGLDTTVVFSTAAVTATDGSDFTTTSGTLTIAAGSTATGTITVAVSGDTLLETNESFTVDLSSPINATIASGTATGTIQNDDEELTLSIGNLSLSEGNCGTTNFVFTVTQSATSGLETTVVFSTAAGTATADSDFTATSGTLTIAAGSTTGTITVAVAGDTLLEASDTFTVNLSTPNNATIDIGTATGTIQNDDDAPTLSIGNVSLNEGNSGTTSFVFTVTQSATSGLDTTVVFSTAAGTATADSDFTATSGTLTIAAGSTTGTITVAVAGDAVLEANESFTVTLSSPSNATIASGTATGTIQNDDTAPTLSIGNVSLNEGNSGTTNLVFTVTQSATSSLDTTVVFSTAAGTATAGSDFTATSGTLTIAAGAASGTITVAVAGDTVVEVNETFTVNLSTPNNATIASGTATGTIQNDDIATPTPTERAFDFNYLMPSGSSPTEPGYTGVLPSELYSSTKGYGWVTAPGAFDRSTSSALGRDGAFGTRDTATGNPGARTFAVDVPDGVYLVGVVMGDSLVQHDLMQVKAEGAAKLTGVTNTAGSWVYNSFTVQVSDGRLDLEFTDQGGTNRDWVVNSLTVRPVGAARQITFDTVPSIITDGVTLNAFSASTDLPDGTLVNVAVTNGQLASPDADATLTGTQVRVVGGTIDFSITSNTFANAVVTLAAIDGSALVTATATPSTNIPATRRFDFNASAASGGDNITAPGFIGVLGNTIYSGVGYGWTAPQAEYQRRTPNAALASPLLRDAHFNLGTPGIFQVAAKPDVTYNVRVYVGDFAADRTDIRILVEGVAVPYDVPALVAGTFNTHVTAGARDVNGDGRINVAISSKISRYWVAGGIDVWESTVGDPAAQFQSAAISGQEAIKQIANPTGLTDAALAPIVQEAIARWAATGLNSAQVALLQAIQVQIVDLGDNGELGVAIPSRIELDDDAAGQGWFIDPTPYDDSEFVSVGQAPNELSSAPGSPAAGKIDLLTVVMHELGHELGFDDISADVLAHDIMTQTLGAGTRRLPATSAAPVLFSSGASQSAAHERVFANLGASDRASTDAIAPALAVSPAQLPVSTPSGLHSSRGGRIQRIANRPETLWDLK